ncbi:hypothetical protein [Leptolyngbya sp. 7M]|uniref:hypothetical protein n=1 Tax=Leptolyngbya sp. 7M TaxID=2812896 RepID=UPI001B8AA521|nr:hypothetical protein [Leptolyngbya sp. 7M]QYO67881.1 hypothetical protein JVX88_14520 [Leptolyngbya sp. 7M]
MLRKIQLLYPLVSTSGLRMTSGFTNIYDGWSDKDLGIIKNQIQNPAPPAARAAQGFGFYV